MEGTCQIQRFKKISKNITIKHMNNVLKAVAVLLTSRVWINMSINASSGSFFFGTKQAHVF